MTPTAVPDLDSLRAEADEADSRFASHYDVCPTVRIGRWCIACDQLDSEANHAESEYRRARLAGQGVGR